jgi:hypothetical protein
MASHGCHQDRHNFVAKERLVFECCATAIYLTILRNIFQGRKYFFLQACVFQGVSDIYLLANVLKKPSFPKKGLCHLSRSSFFAIHLIIQTLHCPVVKSS